MQVRDEVAWTEQLTEFEADDLSRKFRDFLVFWLNATDKIISDGDPIYAPQGHDGYLIGGFHPALSKGFEIAEQSFGFLSVEWIAQMLLVIAEHWAHGEALFSELSVFEKRLVEQATAMKLAELQETAARVATEQ